MTVAMAELDDRSRRPVPSFTLPAPRRSATGLVVSVLVHLGILVLVAGGLLGGREVIRALGGGAGPGEAGGGGGGGGDRVSYIDLPAVGAAASQSAASAPQEVPQPEPPVEKAPEPVPTPTAVAPPAAVAVAPGSNAGATGQGTGAGPGVGPGTGGGSGGGSGGGVGPGIGPGTGPGTGGDSAGITPPQLQFWVPPAENAPKTLRGRPIIITIWVTATGVVDRFTTDPAIEDRNYRDKLADLIMKTRFKPARTREGVAVPGVTQLTITLGKK